MLKIEPHLRSTNSKDTIAWLTTQTVDLRGYLEQLHHAYPRDLLTIAKPVSPIQEPTALLQRLELENRFPAVWFEHIGDSEIPLLMNVHATRERLALALGVATEELNAAYQCRLEKPIEPITVARGPVKEVVLRGEEADLRRLPILTPSAHTTAPYISGGIVVARDPVSGCRNLSYNRLMVLGPRRMAFHPAPGLHLHAIHKNAISRGEELPVAIIIGYHPAFALGTLAKVPFGVDEYTCAGAMLQQPVTLIRCETIPLEVPANAEIVIEGRVPLHTEEMEGPYDEFTGFAQAPERKPVIEVTAITHRRRPIYQDVFGGASEHLLMGSVPKAASLESRLRGLHPEVRHVHYPLSGCGRLHAVVSVGPHPPAQARKLIVAAFALDHFLKHVWVVDEDVDVFSDREVLWAMSTCLQGDRDVLVLSQMPGTDLDPSAAKGGVGAKVGFDCTRKGSNFPPRNKISNDVLARMIPSAWIGRSNGLPKGK